jgi:hypothetical protein
MMRTFALKEHYLLGSAASHADNDMSVSYKGICCGIV